MFQVFGEAFRGCDGVTRRSALKAGALTLGGLGVGDLLRGRAAAGEAGQAKRKNSVICIWLDGGPTHMETYDPKPDAPEEFAGPFKAIRTSVPGTHINELLPGHAKVMDRLSIIRSMHHDNGDHFAAAHWMTTGYYGSTAANMDPMYPSVGAYIARCRGPNREGMPAFVGLPNAMTVGLRPGYFSSTYLGTAYNPFDGGDPRIKGNLDLPTGVNAPRMEDRVSLLSSFDNLRRDMDSSRLMDGMDKFNKQAVGMVLTGSARSAFDVSLEPQKMHDLYGKDQWAQFALAGRRLVEAGVTFVTLHLGGWDHHSSLEKGMKNVLPRLDRAVSALVTDLDQRGLLDDVMIIVMGEFGRTPRINKGLPQDPVPGRDHWGNSMSILIGGGGIKGGVVVGSTDSRGEAPKERPTCPGDCLATVYHALGMNHEQSFLNNAGRPVPMLTKGEVIRELV